MKSKLMATMAMLALGAGMAAAEGPVVGKTAPDFTLPDLDGKTFTLADFKGSYVVLEWTNYDCPFVVKHYSTGNMQALQREYMAKDVVWLVICSSAPGKQGHFAPQEFKARAAASKTTPTAILLDPDGTVGRRYRARTTPEMFVIDKGGILRYMGAIDSNPSRRHEDVKTADNYVRKAMEALFAGEDVDPAVTRPYGCSVKY